MPREGAGPEDVITRIHDAGGIASMAHPGLPGRDYWIPPLADAGLDALEAYHTDHGPDDTPRYLALAAQLSLAVPGGSDYHADESHGARVPGRRRGHRRNSSACVKSYVLRSVRLQADRDDGPAKAGHYVRQADRLAAIRATASGVAISS